MELILGFVVASIGAFLGSWLTLRRVKSERVWEDKRTTYREIVEALHKIKAEYQNELRRNKLPENLPNEERQPSKSELEDLRKNVSESLKELRKCVDIGGLFISQSTSKLLNEFVKKFDESEYHLQSYGAKEGIRKPNQKYTTVENEFYEHRIQLVSKYLDKVKAQSRYDIYSPNIF